MVDWPPTLPELKNDVSPVIPEGDVEDDDALQTRLDAAITFVQRTRKDLFVLGDDGEPVDPVVFTVDGERREGHSVRLGTMMLAQRLFARRRSPDAVLWMAETGTTRLPFNDGDLARMLRIGRHERPKVG